uniref:L1 transposable element RRM domain-containing protein n=1 Tax=Equus caballus TaxID=9796 RepID=F6PVV0_HORSE
MKNTIEEIKKNLDALNSRANNMEERISNLEDGNIELLQAEEEREVRLKRNEETLRELSDTIRRCNVRIIGIPEGEEKEKGAESLFKEIMAENFPNLVREMDLQVTEANRSSNFINPRRPTPQHMVVKLAKVNDKEKIVRTARQKKLTYKGTPIRLSADFSAETLQARREWNDIFKNLKDKNLQPRILYPAKISFKYDGEIKTFPDKQKLREFIATKPPLQEILRKTLIPEKSKKGKGLQNQEQRR